MKESIGYTVTLNIMMVFITIVVTFLSAALIYFKSNKASNIITSAIEEYEDYELAIAKIERNLQTLGYNKHSIENECTSEPVITGDGSNGGSCNLTPIQAGRGKNGYCVYLCVEEGNEYYFYKIRTNMIFNIPIINDLLDIPIYSDTIRLYDFADKYQ